MEREGICTMTDEELKAARLFLRKGAIEAKNTMASTIRKGTNRIERYQTAETLFDALTKILADLPELDG